MRLRNYDEWNYATKKMTEVPVWYRTLVLIMVWCGVLLSLCVGIVIGHWIF